MSRASVEHGILTRIASSFWDHASRHVGRIDGLLYLMHRLMKEKASRMGLPNTTCAGDILQSGSGVLRAWSNARRRPSLFRDPVEPTLSISMRFVFLTATSARPFDWGKYAEDMRWRTSHLVRKSAVAADENYGPPSLDISSGTPNVANSALRAAIRPWAPACAVPWGALNISTHPDSRSPATR